MSYEEKSHKFEIEYAFQWLTEQYGLDWSLEVERTSKYEYETKVRKPNGEYVPTEITFHPRTKMSHSDYTAWKDVTSRDRNVERCRIRICRNRTDWSVYRRKTVGIMVPRHRVPSSVRRLLALVHEFTHLFERELYWNGGEVKTTTMELKFAYEHYYQYFKRSEPIIDKRRKPNYNSPDYDGIRCVVTAGDEE